MMRSIMLTMLMALSISSSIAQIYDPVDWSFSAKRVSESEAKLTFTADIQTGWHLYSQHLDDGGPIPTSFTFKELGGAKLKGEVQEGEGHTEMDKNFGMTVKFFEGKAEFVQMVELTSAKTKLTGELEFMVCNDERCLPPEYKEFEFTVPEASLEKDMAPSDKGHDSQSEIFEPVTWTFSQKDLGNGEFELQFKATIEEHWHVYSMTLPEETMTLPTAFEFDSLKGVQLDGKVVEPEPITKFDSVNEEELSWFENEVTFTQKVRLTESDGYIKGALNFMACDDEKCLAPEWVDFEFKLSGEVAEGSSSIGESSSKDRSWIGIFIAGFLGGFLALLTPCVFPMIPLTVSFFTKQSKDRAKGITNALLYGFFIIFIYVVLGFAVTVTFGADALNALSTNVWFNLFFFVLLVVFAISFLGAFEITLPSSWVNKADQASDRGGIIGIFFMAFTLSLVSFSCTGPIIGTLLVEAAVNGGVMGPIMGMTGFSLALALPFGLFAAFPGWLNSMPKSGGWLNSVKVVLGLLELALALKFLSNADLVVQAGLLKRELFLAIWIGIFGTLALYLFGFIRFPHDSPANNISIPRYMFGLVVLVFTIYLIPGLWGAPLKIISGFPPPNFYSESPNGFGGGGTVSSAVTLSENGEIVGDPEHCPHGLPCFHDYEEGMAYAKEAGLPVMLDFTGWACVNCRKMEEQVWSDPRVLKRLREDFVLISLYVDEKLELPKDEQIEVTIGGKTKKLRTVGNKWSYMQAERYGNNSQPYYVILDHNENQLGPSAAYDPDIELYVNWLDAGKAAFESVN
ncbi:MAG: thioredoxin family protein [Flavobacteriales bacterium]|nr:thioredoxin family protein [Flavobacteriales bacterium]MCB9191037.1 thioredoxin family protein [Flavobacteriales bacterium]MCB9203384.1 thioredoxin family protein [Flavobacteriales bacterium]